MGMSLGYLATFVFGSVIGYAFAADGQPKLLVAWIALWMIAYPLSLFLHPRRACWTCGGKGFHKGWFFGYGSRPCLSCEGKGWHIRLGSRWLNVDDRGGLRALVGSRNRGSSSSG